MDLQISPEATKEKLDTEKGVVLLDVREQWEHDMARIEGAVLISLGELPQRVKELDPEAPLIVYCHHGVRSFQATLWLRQQGFEKAQNLAGGIDAWSLKVDSSVSRYQGM